MKTTRKQRACEHIRESLLRGSLAAGDRLSPEALARELGMSHIPVREALGQLQSEGLVVQIPHRGTFVRFPDRQEVEDVVALRRVLECHAAALAARRISRAELGQLGDIVRQMRAWVEQIDSFPSRQGQAWLARWGDLDKSFHRVLFDASGNRQLRGVVDSMVVRMSGYGHGAYHLVKVSGLLEGFSGNYRAHRGVYLAVRARDPQEARRAMAVHMRRARKNLLIRFEWISRTRVGHRAMPGDSPQAIVDVRLAAELAGAEEESLTDPQRLARID
jgi:DNA-binding GntR family transcriptional regulator